MALLASKGIALKVAKEFGIPTERLISFDLHFHVGDIVKATCVYAAETKEDDLTEIDITALTSASREYRRV